MSSASNLSLGAVTEAEFLEHSNLIDFSGTLFCGSSLYNQHLPMGLAHSRCSVNNE